MGREPVVPVGHEVDQRLAGDDDHPVSLGGCRDGVGETSHRMTPPRRV